MKPSKVRLKQIYKAPLHRRSANVSAILSKDLRTKYKRRNVRVRVGDVVKIMRGEYKGIEGKVNKVHTNTSRLEIEGVQREKLRGGNAPVLIHASKVMITSLDLSDELRKNKLEGKVSG
ncbi:MAG: 50S ribosomal protein L24 [Candidatus Nitrosocaldaceae archaeon]|nr:MAG: 50S ribosomal protein L24 [Candidatus Nitrosocaldaceae archaeon]